MALLSVSGGNRLYNIILILLLIGGGVLLWFLFSSEEAVRMEQEKITKRIRVVAPEKVKPAPPPEVQKQKKRPAPVKPQKKLAEKKKPTVQKVVKREVKRAEKPRLPQPAVGGSWAVHLASFRTEKEAEELTEGLKKAGYNAYITEFVKDGIRWYRVRVGFWSSREDAKKVAGVLSERFDKPGAWVVKPSKTEILKHTK